MEAALAEPLLLDRKWRLLRLCAVRGAGFPLATLDSLASAVLANAWCDVQAARARQRAVLDDARDQCWQRVRECPGTAQQPWRQALNRIGRRQAPRTLAFDAQGRTLTARIVAAQSALAAAEARLREVYAEEDRALTARIARLGREPRVRAAVAWQNRELLELVFERLQGDPVASDTRARRRTAALYLQRYHAKNEHIGFFGPVAWATIAAGPSVVAAGPRLMASLAVFYEQWAIEALAARYEPALRPLLAPRLSASVRLAGNRLILPDQVVDLDSVQRRFLAALDGRRSARAIIDEFQALPDTGLDSATAVAGLLEQLVEAEVVTWGLVATDDLHPERALARELETLPAAASAAVHAALDRLEHARRALEGASDDDVPARMVDFEQVFGATTGAGGQRYAGRTYAGRTPLYCDGVRAFDCRLDERMFQQLAPALTLVLDSADWFCSQALAQYMEFVEAELNALSARASGDLPLATLWVRLMAQSETLAAISADVVDELQTRWSRVLGALPDGGESHFSAHALRAAAAHEFDVEAPRWVGARFQAPDLLLAASSIEAVARGEWYAVLGEVHVMSNLMGQRVTSKHCPVEAALMQATARVQAEPELIPLNPRGAMGARTAYNLHVTHDIDVEFGSNYSAKPAAQRVRIADLVVRGASGRRMIVSLADGRSWPLMQFLGPQLRSIVVSEFKPMRRKARTPRVSIDRLVVQRAGWRYPAGAIACARLKDRAARYAAWREFSAAAQMPRRLFYRLQGELKPLFLDNHSLVYVDLFLDGVRRLAPQAEVDLGEMLPGPDECWVTDSEGARYTAELRLGAFCGVADE